MNLLLIDDDPVFLNHLRSELNSKQLSAFMASNTGLAFKLLKENKIDLIITGATVPGVPLLSFICALKGRHPETPVILLTAFESNHTAKSALLMGVNALVLKPLNFGLLHSTINKYLA